MNAILTSLIKAVGKHSKVLRVLAATTLVGVSLYFGWPVDLESLKAVI